jgi:hypothetical protein
MKGEAEMPRRATRVPLDDTSELLEDLDRPETRPDRPITAEDVLETFSTPSLEGIARILGQLPENSWGQALRAVVSSEAQATARINRSGTRTRRIQREAMDRYRREANPLPLIRIMPPDVFRDSSTGELVTEAERHERANADLRENAMVDRDTSTPTQIRKMKGKIVICQKAMNGACPVLIDREQENTSWGASDEKLAQMWCRHMVPHAHRESVCHDPFDREDSIPSKYRRRMSCRAAQCNPMEMVPEHRRWKTEKKSKGKLLTHKRTLII